MRGDRDELGLELLRRMKSRAAQHDRHAAADRRVGGQARQRIRPHDADQIRIDLQHLADHGSDQRLVALPRRQGMDRDGDAASAVDVDAAGLHPGGRLVLLVEQRLERRVAAAGLEACSNADAGKQAGRTQAIALRSSAG